MTEPQKAESNQAPAKGGPRDLILENTNPNVGVRVITCKDPQNPKGAKMFCVTPQKPTTIPAEYIALVQDNKANEEIIKTLNPRWA